MLPMRYYPLLLDLSHMECLVVGCGEVGRRKVHGLLQCCPARVTVVDPAAPHQEFLDLQSRHDNLSFHQRPFAASDLTDARLVFICTSDRSVNAMVGTECAKRGILCNMTDDPLQGNFVLPASITRGDLTISVSTNGASPALSRVIRQDLEARYGPEYERMLRLMSHVRAVLLAQGHDSSENRNIFRKLATSDLPELIKRGDHVAIRSLLSSLLPIALHPKIGEWSDDCIKIF